MQNTFFLIRELRILLYCTGTIDSEFEGGYSYWYLMLKISSTDSVIKLFSSTALGLMLRGPNDETLGAV